MATELKSKNFNFRMSDDFSCLLEKLAKNENKTKAQIIEDAVRIYANNGIDFSDYKTQKNIIDSISDIAASNASILKSQEDLRTLIMQVLKNQQG